MTRFYPFLISILVIATGVNAQSRPDTLKKDSTKHLQPVIIRGYLSEQPVIGVPASVSVLSPAQLGLQPDNSFVSVLNTVPGVRAEERSPGSYRLSIRGSLLRSPFGVRDVKIYYDDIPLTDAGGNTYLNAIDVNSINNIEILKGPDGSLFGANSGGVVLLSPVNRYADGDFVSVGFNGGSYGLLHENTALQTRSGNYQLNLNQGYESYGGYRQHSYMQRHFIQAVNKWTYTKDEFRILGFYSDLGYETPGGLTLTQYDTNPQSSRLATKLFPSAIQQRTGIYQKMLLGGAVNEWHISDRLRNVTSVFGSYVDFANPFITNYEQRYEGTYGIRSYFELTGKHLKNYNWKVNAGIEWQQTDADINNYGNRHGVRDTAQTLDKINTNQHFFFSRYAADINKFHIEAALSLNFYDYKFRNVYPNAEGAYTNRNFTPQLMPRIAASYQVTNDFIWRASISRGYSTPTTAEIRPTDNIINTTLQAEHGWNYETGFRLRNQDESTYLDASVFYYRLQNAIVIRGVDPVYETEHYTNAGGTSQPGVEIYFTTWLVKSNNSDFIRGVQFSESVTLNKFTFRNYSDSTKNYSGNNLPGIPGQVFVTSLQVRLPQDLYLFAQYNYTSKIPLDYGNTIYAGRYNLVQAKTGWKHNLKGKTKFEIYAGADNLLNEKYSLGDDLNAPGNRYFNAAPPRNYYAGFNMMF